MIRSSRDVPAGSVVDTDICVIGSGAAGITLALEFAGTGHSVTILESGGLVPDGVTQSLYKGKMTGQPDYPLDACRLRVFGGSTGHWGGWCRPFEPIDFEKREWVPYSGWPITYESLAKYYPLAHDICQVQNVSYEAPDWDLTDPPLKLWGTDVRSRLIQFSPPVRFGVTYRQKLDDAKNVQVLLYANVTSIDLDEGAQQVRGLSVSTLESKHFTVRAKRYVLAAGGIENPRLLLASNAVMKAGVGNQHDQVGRYFMDHIQLDCAQVVPTDSKLNCELYQFEARYRPARPQFPGAKAVPIMGYLALNVDLQRREHLLNYSAHLYKSYWSEYFLHARNADNRDKTAYRKTADALNTIWENLGNATNMALERLPGRGKKMFYKIMATQEQSPNPHSRVMLSTTERDALGMPRAELNWQFTNLDRRSLMVSLKYIAQAFGGNNLAHMRVPLDFTEEAMPPYMRGSWHHYGTTRMGDNPRTSVVDSECKVHGLSNLYIAGCSVFPTSGNGNPTLPLIAMAARLADHLKLQAKRT